MLENGLTAHSLELQGMKALSSFKTYLEDFVSLSVVLKAVGAFTCSQ